MKVVKVLALVLLCEPLAHAAPIKLGVIGDSLSDEYAEETYSYAENWLEQLAVAGKVDAGPVVTVGEPRRSGYAYNWARYGATIQDAVTSGQHTGLKAQVVGAEGVDHVVFAAGANDFGPWTATYWLPGGGETGRRRRSRNH